MTPPKEKKTKGKGIVALVIVVSMCVLSVPCVGGLSAIAIPAFIQYLSRAKISEATSNLNNLFQAASGYYASESWSGGVMGGSANTACVVGNGITSNIPGPGKTVLGPLGEPFESLGFGLRDPVYYRYEIVGVGGCGHTTPGEALYTFRAIGDLDGDGVTSLFEIAATVGPDGSLQRTSGIYRENEFE